METAAIVLAVTELLKLAAKLLQTGRQTRAWSAEEEAAIRAAWETAYQAPHWQPGTKPKSKSPA